MQQEKPCSNLNINLKNCGCTYSSCDKKGKCCECIRFHRERNELPGCLFPPKVERTYDRSVKRFLAINR